MGESREVDLFPLRMWSIESSDWLMVAKSGQVGQDGVVKSKVVKGLRASSCLFFVWLFGSGVLAGGEEEGPRKNQKRPLSTRPPAPLLVQGVDFILRL